MPDQQRDSIKHDAAAGGTPSMPVVNENLLLADASVRVVDALPALKAACKAYFEMAKQTPRESRPKFSFKAPDGQGWNRDEVASIASLCKLYSQQPHLLEPPRERTKPSEMSADDQAFELLKELGLSDTGPLPSLPAAGTTPESPIPEEIRGGTAPKGPAGAKIGKAVDEDEDRSKKAATEILKRYRNRPT